MLTRRNGTQPVFRLRQDMDRLFSELAEGPWALPFIGGGRGFPAINIWEDERNLFAEAEVPGLKLENLEIFVQGDELTIKGRREDTVQVETAFHRRERGIGDFNRVLRLPVEVDADKVQATLRDGVLLVTMPKAEAVLPRRIEVKG